MGLTIHQLAHKERFRLAVLIFTVFTMYLGFCLVFTSHEQLMMVLSLSTRCLLCAEIR